MSVRRRRKSGVLLSELPDGSGVVVHLDKRAYYPLTRTGVVLWHLYDDDRACSDDDLVAALRARYRVDEGVARSDVRAFVQRLVDEGILVDG